MDTKERVLKTLNDFGRLSTSRIAAIIGVNQHKAKDVLDELAKEKKIKKEEETIATYWIIIEVKK